MIETAIAIIAALVKVVPELEDLFRGAASTSPIAKRVVDVLPPESESAKVARELRAQLAAGG